MRFEVVQQLHGSRDAVLEAYTDPAFYERLEGLPKIGHPEVLDKVTEGQRVTMRVRYRFTGDLPSAARAIIDPQKLTWIEETVYDLGEGSATSRLLPDHYPDRLTASAEVRFADNAADGSSSRRDVRGDLKVHMAFVGGKVEGAIVSGLREHLADEARVLNEYLLDR